LPVLVLHVVFAAVQRSFEQHGLPAAPQLPQALPEHVPVMPFPQAPPDATHAAAPPPVEATQQPPPAHAPPSQQGCPPPPHASQVLPPPPPARVVQAVFDAVQAVPDVQHA